MINSGLKHSFLQINPMDTIFCREGFSFQKGSSNWIESLKKPYPSVFYGASISCLLRRGNLKDLLKDKSKIEDQLKQNLQIKGIYIFDEEDKTIWIKAPNDLFVSENYAKIGIYSEDLVWSPEKIYDNASDYWINTDDFLNNYIKGKKMKKNRLRKTSDFYVNYEKTGISIDEFTKTAKESQLYNITMTQFVNDKLSYILDVYHNTLFFKDFKDTILLGGESKTARIKAFDDDLFKFRRLVKIYEYEEITKISSNCIKLIFTDPIKLDKLKIKKISDGFNNFSIKYQVSSRPKAIGGYDMANKKAKQMQIMIPEGAVWIIESEKFKNKTLKEARYLIEEQFEELISENYKGFGNFVISKFEGDE